MLIFPLINDTSRKIIHIDMDAFFAAVEERDNPELKGKPVIIGADPRKSGGRGVVSTCNYEARKFGVHSAMSSKEAFERCPQAIFISGNHRKYREIGYQIREIFKRYTDLDEADIKAEISRNAQRVTETLKKNKKVGRTVVLKVRYADFSTLTKRVTLDDVTSDFDLINQSARSIYDSLDENPAGIRLLGVTVTGLEDGKIDIPLDLY
jgi:DNA polymerase-4